MLAIWDAEDKINNITVMIKLYAWRRIYNQVFIITLILFT